MPDDSCFGINHSVISKQQRSLSAISSSLEFNNSLNTILATLSKISKLNFALTSHTTKPLEQNNLPSNSFMESMKMRIRLCLNTVLTSNKLILNSVVRLDITSENRFRRVFISYGACAMDFANCRPLLGLDGTHLKIMYKGILLLPLRSMQKINCFLLHMRVVILRISRIGFGCLNFCVELLRKMFRNFFNQEYSSDLLY